MCQVCMRCDPVGLLVAIILNIALVCLFFSSLSDPSLSATMDVNDGNPPVPVQVHAPPPGNDGGPPAAEPANDEEPPPPQPPAPPDTAFHDLIPCVGFTEPNWARFLQQGVDSLESLSLFSDADMNMLFETPGLRTVIVKHRLKFRGIRDLYISW
jgi:hypothetical protein